MTFKFKIRFEDDTEETSHDENWKQVKDHAHFLPPHCTKKWKQYYLIGENGFTVAVDFEKGTFFINGVTLHPSRWQSELLTSRKAEYKPIFGRRNFVGNEGSLTLFFCGWKANIEGKHYQKILYVLPNCEIIFEDS